MGKSTINGQFSIAMLVHQRVSTLCIGGSTNMHQSWRSPIPMSYPVPGISTVPGVTMITRVNSAYPHSNE